MATLTSSSSFLRHDSSELCQVDISSPKKRRADEIWEDNSSEHEEAGCRGRMQERVAKAIHDPDAFPVSTFLVEHSWCVSARVFLIWRTMMFIYLVVTLAVLGFKGAFLTSEISMTIYFGQVIGTFFALLSSTSIFLNIENELRTQKPERVIWPGETYEGTDCDVEERNPPPTNREVLLRKITAGTDTITLILLQNLSAIVLFWNIVFWFRMDETERLMTADHTVDLVLHCYNFVPVLFEIVIGAAVFRSKYYLCGIAFVTYILVRIGVGWSPMLSQDQNILDETLGSFQRQHNRWLMTGELIQMFFMFMGSCVTISITQRTRQYLIRRLSTRV